ncbi:restriction endonuclease subunit S [Stutzerimonas stutzeri]|uniref:restriction endonuclease subunit S n=1 Tax=Stutzerimonas stutzeri TaxID=316 RepID=UPI0021AD62CC|nr:restriction endonuclease subunit S [Stutzerimonas stutzeri]
MSFPAYSAYMDAGVDWLGKIPEHWQQKWLGLLAVESRTAFVDGPFGSDLKSSDYQDEGVPLIQLNNIRDGQHVLRNMKFISEEKRNELSRHSAFPGDIVIAKMADPVARSAIVSDEFSEYVIVADCVKMTPDLASVDLSFLIWAINSDCVRISAELMSSGVTRIRINLGQVKKLRIPYPPLREQTQIARFLDHETARIDALIEEQQRLIELLKEKRQAVISHAVTKGLDPTVPMKDSGVEWLGEMPAHWEVKQLKHVVDPNTSITYGIVQAGPEFEGGIPYIRTSDMSGEELPISGYPLTSPEIDESYARSRVRPGDIVMSIRASVGKCLPVPDELKVANLTQGTAKISAGQGITRNFLLAFLNAEATQNYFDLMAKGATFKEITLDALRRTPVLLPPAGEQIKIDQFVARHTSLLDDTCKQAIQSVSLLQERRSALISAAVTGKIDVRGWQSPASAKAPVLEAEAV